MNLLAYKKSNKPTNPRAYHANLRVAVKPEVTPDGEVGYFYSLILNEKGCKKIGVKPDSRIGICFDNGTLSIFVGEGCSLIALDYNRYKLNLFQQDIPPLFAAIGVEPPTADYYFLIGSDFLFEGGYHFTLIREGEK